MCKCLDASKTTHSGMCVRIDMYVYMYMLMHILVCRYVSVASEAGAERMTSEHIIGSSTTALKTNEGKLQTRKGLGTMTGLFESFQKSGAPYMDPQKQHPLSKGPKTGPAI